MARDTCTLWGLEQWFYGDSYEPLRLLVGREDRFERFCPIVFTTRKDAVTASQDYWKSRIVKFVREEAPPKAPKKRK